MYRCIVCGYTKTAVNGYLGEHPICSVSCMQDIIDMLSKDVYKKRRGVKIGRASCRERV